MRILLWFVTLIMTTGCQSSVIGTTTSESGAPAPLKPSWVSTAEVEALNKDESKEPDVKQLDFFVFFATQATDDAVRTRHVSAGVLLVKYYLHQLFYQVDFDKTDHPADDPEFYSALVAFERRAELPVDGKFTVAEFEKLSYLAELEHETEISAAFKFVSVDNLYASAEGTWTLQGDTIAYPVNRTQIWCWRPQQTCTVFTANVALPRESGIAGTTTLLTDIQHYDVSRWTAIEVQARAQSDCRQTVVTINGETKQVYEVTTDLTKEGCPIVGPMGKPKVATLEDSGDVIRKAYEGRKAPAKSVSNSPMQRIRELMQQDSARSARPQ